MNIFRNVKRNLEARRGRFLAKKLYRNDFSIISDNCWGGFVYKYFDMTYNSPFVGLFIFSPDYIHMLQNLNFYLDSKLCFIDPSESKYKQELINNGTFNSYPIALLGDGVEIHFLHYKNNKEALDKWSRRLSRLNRDNLVIKFCDRDLCTEMLINDFDSLSFKRKIVLSAKHYNVKSNLKLKGENADVINAEWESFLKTTSPLSFMNKLWRK
ncbi:DUF1919 domain-containing protein [Shewanella sp. S1-49-MNA-CIBAN-0167]|uniref:DUF1919 domain-containing protein n=1 Tax=Shewanella sp. S1-49-MNA-CIBAN-0167 TaxID=3140468 RepID=UPI003320200A